MDNWSYDSDVSVRYLWIFLVKKYTCIGFSRLSTKASLFCEKNYLTLSIEKKWIVKIKKKKLIFLNRIDTKMWTFYLVFFLKWCVVCFISGWCNIFGKSNHLILRKLPSCKITPYSAKCCIFFRNFFTFSCLLQGGTNLCWPDYWCPIVCTQKIGDPSVLSHGSEIQQSADEGFAVCRSQKASPDCI